MKFSEIQADIRVVIKDGGFEKVEVAGSTFGILGAIVFLVNKVEGRQEGFKKRVISLLEDSKVSNYIEGVKGLSSVSSVERTKITEDIKKRMGIL